MGTLHQKKQIILCFIMMFFVKQDFSILMHNC